MSATSHPHAILEDLNDRQRAAATHGDDPLLIVAGAGTGKTRTLVHRVACQIASGVDPSRMLLLTFTRRAAAEMLRRVDGVLRRLPDTRAVGKKVWGGTFHAVASRLLRSHGKAIGLGPRFSIHDRSDSEDLLNVIRTELGLAKSDKRFPKKSTCMSIYSRCVNSQRPLEEVLEEAFPWCDDYAEELKELFRAYVDRKQALSILDYDDLLLFWHGLLAHPTAGEKVRRRFDCVLVDEYQDTNRLQAAILRQLRPDGNGLTVVGDDAQSIYSFRAATVRNILDFPQEFAGTRVITLEQNYRSTNAILQATNQVIAQSPERYAKDLWTSRNGGQAPRLITCEDEDDQTENLITQILRHREAGIDLQRQAVLFRASHHSMVLEAELTRRNVPFIKYGGLKFIETAHVKDLMAFLRLAENPRDLMAGSRILGLLPGIGPKRAARFMDLLLASNGDFAAWERCNPPKAAQEHWPGLVSLMKGLATASGQELPSQIHRIRKFYTPLAEEKYEAADARLRDLEQLEQLSARFRDRSTMLAEITLDPPSTSEDFAGPPELDEDYLILSTIHSAKGLEWDCVYVIHAADGNIPSDMAVSSPEGVEEERRLFYVALTRAKSWLYVYQPLRYYYTYGPSNVGHRYGYAQLTRFIPDSVKQAFRTHVTSGSPAGEPDEGEETGADEIWSQAKSLWA